MLDKCGAWRPPHPDRPPPPALSTWPVRFPRTLPSQCKVPFSFPDRPTRTYRRTVSTTQQQQQQVVPHESTYETHSTHTDIDLYHQQVPNASHHYSSQTYIQPQQQPVPTVNTSTTTTTTTMYSQQQQVPLHSNVPQAPPMLPEFGQRTHYSELKIKFLNGGLKDTPLYSGSETVMECQFSGQPERVQWFRNEIEIINNPQQFNNR